MISCDLCGTPAECLQKEIDGEEFDVCVDCWHPLSEKLSSKGRVREIPGSGAAIYLASDRASSFVTGSIMRVDGGFGAMTI